MGVERSPESGHGPRERVPLTPGGGKVFRVSVMNQKIDLSERVPFSVLCAGEVDPYTIPSSTSALRSVRLLNNRHLNEFSPYKMFRRRLEGTLDPWGARRSEGQSIAIEGNPRNLMDARAPETFDNRTIFISKTP